MLILGIDTATWRASVGLTDGDRVLAERFAQTTGNHAASLLSLIELTLADAGRRTSELDAVAVSTGPGSFTGVRVGISVAKGLAWSLGRPLVGVPTLHALALAAGVADGTVAAVLDARKGELYAAVFRLRSGRCERMTEDALVRPENLPALLGPACTIIGDATERYGNWFREHLGAEVRLLEYPAHGPRGAVIAQLGEERLRTGAVASLADLEPSYVRPADAEMKSC